ncbi:MAG: alpha/beta hydrolase [Mycetocola sp.]
MSVEPIPANGADFATQFDGRISSAADALLKLTPSQVAVLWHGLPAAFIQRLINERPDVVGNLEGAKYADRDRANIRRLVSVHENAVDSREQALSRFRTVVSEAAAAIQLAEAEAKVDAIDTLLDVVADRSGSDARKYLISLDDTVDGPPLAAIAVGDLDVALYSTFFVPGMNSSLLEADDYIRGVTRIQQASADSAAVLWLGYESPGPVETVSTARAEVGAVKLGAALEGYDAYRDTVGLPSELTVLGHSYGSTTAAIALAADNYGVSSFVMIGSAGVPSNIRLEDLQVRPDRVYASEAMADVMAGKGQFWSGRVNPASVSWGAQLFGSNGATLDDGTVLAAVTAHDVVGPDTDEDHDKYLGDGTESLYDIQMIVTGQRHEITPDSRTQTTDAPILADGAK